MSVLVEEFNSAPPLQPGASSPSRTSQTEKNVLRLGTKKFIRLDSPTTVQACNELGFLLDDLKQKAIEEFRDPNVEEALVQLRFNHYMKRYNQTLKDVAARKRQINRRLRHQQLELQLSPDHRKSTGSSPLPPQHFTSAVMTTMGSPLNQTKPTTPLASFRSSPIAVNFNRTVTYLRKSHGSAAVKNLDEIIGEDDPLNSQTNSPLSTFRKTLSDEIYKFNKIKKLKQQEAKEVYEMDLKRVKLLEEEKQREDKRKEKEKKIALAKKQKQEEKKRILEEKTDKIKELGKNYEYNKEQEKQKMKEKLEGAKKKFEEEMEQRKRAIFEREMRMEQKMKEAKERREKYREEELRNCDQMKADIEEKLFMTDEKHRLNLHHKSKSVKERLDQIEECVTKNKEKQMQETEEYVQRLTAKLVKDEENVRSFREKHTKEMKKRQAAAAEKDRRLEVHQKDIDGQYNDRMAEINERFQKVQENLETKRQIDEQNRKLKGEHNRLKLLDKLENHSRLQRRLQFERLKILDKEKHEQEKVYWLKSHREFAQKAKLEVAIQSKIEKDIIEDGTNHLSKLVYGAHSTRSITDSQKRIIKAIFRPEDYKEIEDTEKKKEAEKKAKLGLPEEINSALSNQNKKKH